MSDPFHIVVGQATINQPLALSSQVFVPVRSAGVPDADGSWPVVDNGGDIIARCFTRAFADKVTELINRDTGL